MKFCGRVGYSGLGLGQYGSRDLENEENELLGLCLGLAFVPSSTRGGGWVGRRRLRSKSEISEDWDG